MKRIFKNKEYYLNNTISTFNGVVYKNEEAFRTGDGVCYISEYDLQELKHGATVESVAETRASILEKCQYYCPNNWTLEAFANLVFEIADWACIETTLETVIECVEDIEALEEEDEA